MAPMFILPLLLLFHSLLPAQSNLTTDFYTKSCPKFSEIVEDVVIEKQLAVPTTAAGALRLFFHDCIVGGCDASLLISSTSSNQAERDYDINQALPGDAFDIVIRAKTKLELECPDVVSCSDILAEATRDLVSMVGGPFYTVRLGRRDGIVSRAADVDGHIARPNMSLSHIIDLFGDRGFDVEEMVALVGAHTIGFSHCFEFADRIYHFSDEWEVDPTMNPAFADGLRELCANYTADPTIAAFNDPMTPGKFDNKYYENLQKGVGLLGTDQKLAMDDRTNSLVDVYAANETAFFEAFSKAMEKVSELNVLTGSQGEVRKRCDSPN